MVGFFAREPLKGCEERSKILAQLRWMWGRTFFR
jgi:hypothetical protein